MTSGERLLSLLHLRARVDAEIVELEGLMAAETERIRRARRAGYKRRPKAVCGTDGGYYRHRRTLHEPACEACLLAHRMAERDRKARRVEAA